MEIYNNIFAQSNNNIFYMKIDGEIYQVKVENLVYQINSVHVTSMVDYFRFNDRNISTIKINVASKGEMVWYEHIYSSPFNPTEIYQSVEDCINEENSVFKRKGFQVVMNDVDTICVEKEEFEPTFASWQHSGRDFFGNEIYMLRTYMWDGTKAICKRLETNPHKFRGKVFYNSNHDSCFDLVHEEWLIDDEYAQGCYKTYEECINSNFIKVHTF